jgi:hypothetical protein
MKEHLSYDDYIKRSILKNNDYGITEVNGLVDIKSMSLQREEYPKIVELIKSSNIEALADLAGPANKTSEYISIMKFSDQIDKPYIVTTYDSDEIWQDPQVIDIFAL